MTHATLTLKRHHVCFVDVNGQSCVGHRETKAKHAVGCLTGASSRREPITTTLRLCSVKEENRRQAPGRTGVGISGKVGRNDLLDVSAVKDCARVKGHRLFVLELGLTCLCHV